MNWTPYLSLFLIGFLGSGHCLAMCGGFSMLLGQGESSKGNLVARYSAYQSGKALSYMFLGALVSVAGGALAGSVGFERLQVVLGVLAGFFMILFGLGYLTDWRYRLPRVLGGKLAQSCSPLLKLLQMRTSGGAFLFGWFNGFLPCGLVWVALGYIASFTSISVGIVGAFFFGLGTFPALLALALTQQQLSLQKRKWIMRFAGLLLILFGILSALRWHPTVHHWFHHNLVIEMDAGQN